MKSGTIVKIILVFLGVGLISAFSFILGRKSVSNIQNTTASDQFSTYTGKVYSVTYPNNWVFEGPSEGPITGFPEFAKLISPSGDMQIYIGLKGDNRFEFAFQDIKSNRNKTEILIGGKIYQAEEEFLSINQDPQYNVVTLDVELEDVRDLGYRIYSQEALLPLKIQILYRFSSDGGIPFEEKMKDYNKEKEAAISILKTFKAN